MAYKNQRRIDRIHKTDLPQFQYARSVNGLVPLPHSLGEVSCGSDGVDLESVGGRLTVLLRDQQLENVGQEKGPLLMSMDDSVLLSGQTAHRPTNHFPFFEPQYL